MDHTRELQEERAYTARVQRLLLAIIEQADIQSGEHLDSIRAIVADAWEELRLRPTELSVQEMEQLSGEVDRVAARRDFVRNLAERYRRMLMEPFFARVDFREDGEDGIDKIVIGLYGLQDEKGDILVHDWRAPICSLYYDSMPGETSYDCPDGKIMGTVTLKRQYRMENGQLKYYVDTQVSIEDDMLLDLLSGDSSHYMRQIAATIQKEQNAAVRCEKAKVVSVVGGAGSGKTSVAMHRAAYLMYRQRDELDASKILIVTPGQAFSEYISHVLPELGEENIRSATMSDIVGSVLGKKVESLNSQMDRLLSGNEILREQSVGYKSGKAFLETLKKTADTFGVMGPDFKDVTLDGNVLIRWDELNKMYRNELRLLSPAQRLDRMRTTLDARMESWEEKLRRQYENSYGDKYHGKELRTIVQLAVSRQMQPMRHELREAMNINAVTLMRSALKDAPEDIRTAFEENTNAGLLWWEDATAQAYLMLKLGFAPVNKHIFHVLVDEAQDYSETELALLHLRYPNAKVTILGDPRQRTCPGMPDCVPENWSFCFDETDAPVFVLNKCYRSTAQISELCNRILPAGVEKMTPFGRNGETPRIERYSMERAKAELERLRKQGYGSIAVLTRTRESCEALADELENVYRLDGSEEDIHYETTDNVVACYHMVKGMEFDTVVCVWPDMELTDGERRRLYTACTRALHSVTILTEGRLLKELKEEPVCDA